MHYGCSLRSRTSKRKSSMSVCTLVDKRKRVPFSVCTFRTFYNTLNIHLPPVTARTMYRSSPTSCCHFLILARH
jgi:hypothetical protein